LVVCLQAALTSRPTGASTHAGAPTCTRSLAGRRRASGCAAP
jgi:hypothetical protein